MANKFFWTIKCMMLSGILFFCGCTTISTTPVLYSNNSNYDFIILGEVTYKGRFGFQELLKAARFKYPSCDYVIDVMADSETKTTKFFFLSGTSITYTMRGTAIRYIRDNIVTFPLNFLGTWKRDNFNDTLTFTENSIKSSSQANSMNLIDVSDDLYALAYGNNDRTFVSVKRTTSTAG